VIFTVAKFHVLTLQIHATPWPLCSNSTPSPSLTIFWCSLFPHSPKPKSSHYEFRFLYGVIPEPPRSSEPFLRPLLATNAATRSHELRLAQGVCGGRERGVSGSNGGPWRVPQR